MLRGFTTFVCDNCGHKFKAMDIEWQATAASQPVKCPKCGNFTNHKAGLFQSIQLLYKGFKKFKGKE